MDKVTELAHWRLDGSAGDLDGMPNGLVTASYLTYASSDGGEQAARFDGRRSKVSVRQPPLGGKDPFTVAMWVHTEAVLDDVLGDLLSWYDPTTRRGFNLGIINAHGVTSHQPNYRNLYFGIDAGSKPVWRDCGRPGNAVYVMALATFEGSLYAGTFETNLGESGHVYRYRGADMAGDASGTAAKNGSSGAPVGTSADLWEDCGSPDPCNAVAALAVHDGALYAGVMRYNAGGSSLPESPNTHPGGRVYRYAGGQEWIDCGQLPGADSVLCLTVYRGELYAIPIYSQGVFRYEGGTSWRDCGSPGRRLMSLTVHNGHLYAAGNEGGGVFRYDGDRSWEACGFQEGMTQIYSFAPHYGGLHIGAWPQARVYEYDGRRHWLDRGLMGEEKEVMAMMVYNGKLYAGTLPLAEIYRYDGDAEWTRLQQLDLTPNVRYRRAWSMATYAGRLYCGTLPSGRVISMEAGKCVTHDDSLRPGWRHIAASRSESSLALFVDGQKVTSLDAGEIGSMDIGNERPLTIGYGPQDHFNGMMRDVRIFRGALPEDEVQRLATTGRGETG